MQITLDNFLKYITAKRKLYKKIKQLYTLGIDIMVLGDDISEIYDPLLDSVCNPAQKECLEWWLYDAPDGITADPKQHGWIEFGKTRFDLTTPIKLYEYLSTIPQESESKVVKITSKTEAQTQTP